MKNNQEGNVFIIILVVLFLLNLLFSFISFVGQELHQYFNNWEKTKVEQKQQEVDKEVIAFVKNFSPDLLNKIVEIDAETKNADSNIKKLESLAEKFPDQRALISESINTWREIRDALLASSNDIKSNTRTSYVTYKIDEIKGRKSFNDIKNQLLEKANKSLASAAHLRSTIQEVSSK